MDDPNNSLKIAQTKEHINQETSLLTTKKDNNHPHLIPIKQIKEEFKLTRIHIKAIMSLIVLKDKRIASGSIDGSISICSLNINDKQWTRNIHKENAHNNWVCTLCELSDNTLISGGADYKAKIWKIMDNDIKNIKIISTFSNIINSIITLTKSRFCSCSDDKKIQIWEEVNYQHITIFNSDVDFYKSIVQPQGKEILVSCGYTSYLSFWNLDTYVNIHNMKGYNVSRPTYMIGLHDGNIALCSKIDHESIIIINTSSYEEIVRIKLEKFIIKPSTLCIMNDYSFIYVRDGSVVQVSNLDYSVVSKLKGLKFDGWFGGVVLIEEGNYFITTSGFDLSVVKIEYE